MSATQRRVAGDDTEGDIESVVVDEQIDLWPFASRTPSSPASSPLSSITGSMRILHLRSMRGIDRDNRLYGGRDPGFIPIKVDKKR